MTISAISTACPPPVLDVSGPMHRQGKDVHVSPAGSQGAAAKPKPNPRDSADFLRAIMDDCHPGSDDTFEFHNEVEVADVTGTIPAPRALTNEERQAAILGRKAMLQSVRAETESERDAKHEQVLADRVRGRLESTMEFRQIRAESLEKDAALSDVCQSELLEIRRGVENRLGQRDGHAYADLGTDVGLFAFSESNFGDSFELSWGSAEALASKESSGASEPSPAVSSLNASA